ncbi:hypothetical protein FSP39_001530 [Pinctada imbricata]|uniref:Uncharacterized protein n=1 Tax=Pinctada imbricata TaxID=66713 RepID=A0AA88Y1G5_PINIB|nr:hypothetical protein FSP39_001530 [Pinctada imbricata]
MEYGDYWRLPSPPTVANKPGNLTVVGEYLPHKPPAPQRIRKTVTKIQGLLQVQALSLLTVVGQSDGGIADIIDDTNAVPYTLCCVKHTKCRKVRAKALELVGLLGATRRLGLCKDLMSHIANYLIPSNSDLVLNNSDTRSRSPVKGRYERESQLWRGLDKLVELICDILCKDAMVERDNLGSVMGIRYNPCVDMCSPRLDSLIQCLTVLHNVCIWPASKSKHQVAKVDLTNFTDDEDQRSRLHKLNKTQAQALWDTVGTVVMEILLVFSKKVSNVSRIARDMRDGSRETCEKHQNIKEEERPNSSFSPKVTDKVGAVDLFAVFEEKEIELIIKILEFLLVASLCTCKEFKDFTTKTKNKSSKKNLLGGRSTKSDTCLGRSSSPEKLTKSASAVYRPSSPTKLCEEDHTKKQHKDLLEKEAATDRRLMRKCLYEADIFSAVAPFIYCTHTNCQVRH